MLRKRYFINKFHGSIDKPNLKINNKEILSGDIDNNSGLWKYHISLGDKNLGASINLEKNCRAWNGKTFLGNWLVIPRFKVKGTIFLDGKKIDGYGVGYHDHNIYPIYAPFFNKGYDFGKIRCGSFDIIWANVIKNKNNEEIIIVLNSEQKAIVIPLKDVEFSVKKKITDNKKNIPIIYHIKINNEHLFLDVKIHSRKIHHIHLPAVNYWRHHVKNIGEMKINSKNLKIDNNEIIEQLRFL
jgi:hypothetical protein